MKRKGMIWWDTPIAWIIAIAVLILGFMIFGIFSDRGQGFIQYIKDFLRFGR